MSRVTLNKVTSTRSLLRTRSLVESLSRNLSRTRSINLSRKLSQHVSKLVVVPEDEDGYADPRPPPTSKEDIFNPRVYTQVDQHALQAPKEAGDGFDELLGYLLQDLDTDLAKLRAIYRWIVSQHIPLEVKPRDITEDSPVGFLFRIRERLSTYPELFSVLCRKAGLPCVIIYGVAKGVAYDVGDKVTHRRMKNSWNAVYIDNAWRFVHPYWASQSARGYGSGRWTVVECDDFHNDSEDTRQLVAHTVNDFFFLTDPDKFITKCFPDDPSWQLLSKPLTKEDFEELPFLQPTFYELKLKLKSHKTCLLYAEDGKVEIVIEMPKDKIKRYKFKYKLFINRDCEDEGEYEPVSLDRYLLHYIKNELAYFEIRFPIKGVYKLELHCNDSKRSLPSAWICDYKIICHKTVPECEPLPVVPSIGWGPGHELEQAGIECLTHRHGLVDLDRECVTFIRFALPKDKEVAMEAELLKNNEPREELMNHVVLEQDGDHAIVQVAPPSEGEYALQLYLTDENENAGKSRSNICNFLMHRTQIVEDPELADIRNELIKATETGDYETLFLWIERFQDKHMEDRGDLTTAKKKLHLARLNRDIREAIARKDLDLLERTMHSISNTSLKASLGDLTSEAEAMRSRLRRLKRLRHEVLALDQKTISEMRSYPKPPAAVHGVMAATFLLLGNKEIELKKWSKIQGLISKKGKMSLKRRVAEFNSDTVSPAVMIRVQSILSKYDIESVQIASTGAATFYQWAHSMAGIADPNE